MKRVTNGDIIVARKNWHSAEGSEFLTENNKIAKTFNLFLETVTDSFNLFSWPSKVNFSDDKVQGIILNILNHFSIL